MHELALCGSIARIVSRHADGRDVGVVRLRVGRLRQVVPDTLSYCWTLVTESTPLSGSCLEIEQVAVQIRCRGCGAQDELDDELLFACRSCGASDLDVLSGEEFSVASIDVTTEAAGV